MMRALALPFLLAALASSAQDCPGVIEYWTAYGRCKPVVVPEFEVRYAVEGVDTQWYASASAARDTAWMKEAWAWIEHVNDSVCPRERVVRYKPCDPAIPDTLTYTGLVNSDPNRSLAVDWRQVISIRFINLRILSLPPNYKRIAYLAGGDVTGVRFMPDGRWKMPAPSNAYCAQSPAPSAWLLPAVIPEATIAFPSPVDIVYYLGRTSSGAAWQYQADKVQVLLKP